MQGNDVKDLNEMVDNENSNGRTHDVAETVDGESVIFEVSDVCKL